MAILWTLRLGGTFAPMKIFLVASSFILLSCYGYNQNPKIYQHVDIVESIHALRQGFAIRIHGHLLKTQLHHDNVPTVYLTASPLHKFDAAQRDIIYKIGAKSDLKLLNLTRDAWYYVCVEFENEHRTQRNGNFSTQCDIHRTLNKFGSPSGNLTKFLDWRSLQDTSVFAGVEVDTNFPLEISFYLEESPLVQTFIVTQRRSMEVKFTHLLPGKHYGRLCVLERPLVTAYTAMGRSIQKSLKYCYPGSGVTTETLRKSEFLSSPRGGSSPGHKSANLHQQRRHVTSSSDGPTSGVASQKSQRFFLSLVHPSLVMKSSIYSAVFYLFVR